MLVTLLRMPLEWSPTRHYQSPLMPFNEYRLLWMSLSGEVFQYLLYIVEVVNPAEFLLKAFL